MKTANFYIVKYKFKFNEILNKHWHACWAIMLLSDTLMYTLGKLNHGDQELFHTKLQGLNIGICSP